MDTESASIFEALRGVLCEVAEPNTLLAAILQTAVTGTSADRGLFVEVQADGQLEYRVLHGYRSRHYEGDADGFSRHLFGRVIEQGQPVRLDSVIDDPFYGGIGSVQALRTGSILCMPIHSGGRIAALVHLECRRSGHFTEEHVQKLRALFTIASPALGALQAGRDVLEQRDRLRLSEQRLRDETEQTRELLATDWSFGRFVGRSPSVRDLEDSVRKAAANEFPVLLEGEPGTGKSILARTLHYGGPRAGRPFITVFCPSLEKGMVEAELFGHKRGAFTGALADRAGKVQAADGGTLFLDEIGELPLEIQPKLLRFLQDRTFERVGDPAERQADVRVIAATNRDLEREVREGRFRRDLYDRLNFIPIRIPPLRERRADIPLLLRHCLDRSDSGRWIEVAPEALSHLETLDFDWPGNVRHLEQLAARLIVAAPRGSAGIEQISTLLDIRPAPPGGEGDGDSASLDRGLTSLVEDAERAWIEEALRRHPKATRAELAQKLKISESALYRKLRQYGIGE